MYDYCAIGAGMIGSSAAKYLSSKCGGEVLLIGIEEPKREDYANHDFFGAYYDEGRITRNLDRDPVWGLLARESIKRYRKIEDQSGVKFYKENGYLFLADEDCQYIAESIECARKLNIPIHLLPNSGLVQHQFPYLFPHPKMVGIYESRNSGTVNPRKMVQAQLEITKNNGAKIVHDIVTGVVLGSNWDIKTKSSGIFKTKKVLICPGAFLFHMREMPKKLGLLDLRPKTIVAARIRIDSPGGFCQKLKDSMPSIFFVSKKHFENESNGNNRGISFYMLQPVEYPDGEWYLKLGMDSTTYSRSPQEISAWFWNGPQSNQAQMEGKLLKNIAKHFIPGLNFCC